MVKYVINKNFILFEEVNMIEVEEKYAFKDVIKKLEDYICNIEFNVDETNKINRLLFKLRNIDSISENVDESLYSSIIENDYKNLINYCDNFCNGNHNCLNNLFNITNSILNNILQYIDYSILLNNKTGIKNGVKNYKTEITRQSNLIGKEIQELMEYMHQLKKNLEDEDSNINMLFGGLNKKTDELDNKQTTINKNADELISQSKTRIESLIKEEKEKLEKNYESEKNGLNSKFDEIAKENVEKFDKLYEDVKAKDKQISNLLDIVGDKARIGEYNKNANASRLERFVWQGVTILLFIVALLIMMYVTFCIENYDKFTIVKYLISAIIMGAATYTGRQASNSRKDEVYYRKQELELASIDVYLDNMSQPNKELIKKELSSKMFGQAQNTYTTKYEDKNSFSIDDLIKIIESIQKK